MLTIFWAFQKVDVQKVFVFAEIVTCLISNGVQADQGPKILNLVDEYVK